MLTADRRIDTDAVVLLHGIPGSSTTWRGVRASLAASVPVLAPDLLGFGTAAEPSGDGHAVEQARAILSLLNDAGVRTAHLVGFDFGGPVAVALHSLASHRLSGMTLIATNLLSDTPVPFPLRIARVTGAGDLAFRGLCSAPGMAMMWCAATGDRKAFPFRRFSSAIDRRGRSATRRIFLNSIRHLETLYRPIEDELSRIAVPVTVLWGDRDPFFPVDVGKRTAHRIARSRFVLLSGCGHFIPEERPREVADAISEAISGSGNLNDE